MLIHGVHLIESQDMVLRHQRNTRKPFEAESITAWRAAAEAGGVMLDIGAYTGLYSLVAAQAGATAIALEPNPAVFARLMENIAANGVSVDARNLAASDRYGVMALQANPRVPLTSGGRLVPGEGVQVVTIDGLGLSGVGAIKIDTEGHECAVLRGAMATIERDKPMIITEALAGDAFLDQCELLEPLGYWWESLDEWNHLWLA